jgi:hypothetical protein
MMTTKGETKTSIEDELRRLEDELRRTDEEYRQRVKELDRLGEERTRVGMKRSRVLDEKRNAQYFAEAAEKGPMPSSVELGATLAANQAERERIKSEYADAMRAIDAADDDAMQKEVDRLTPYRHDAMPVAPGRYLVLFDCGTNQNQVKIVTIDEQWFPKNAMSYTSENSVFLSRIPEPDEQEPKQ